MDVSNVFPFFDVETLAQLRMLAIGGGLLIMACIGIAAFDKRRFY